MPRNIILNLLKNYLKGQENDKKVLQLNNIYKIIWLSHHQMKLVQKIIKLHLMAKTIMSLIIFNSKLFKPS